jgi:hypothetical protein
MPDPRGVRTGAAVASRRLDWDLAPPTRQRMLSLSFEPESPFKGGGGGRAPSPYRRPTVDAELAAMHQPPRPQRLFENPQPPRGPPSAPSLPRSQSTPSMQHAEDVPTFQRVETEAERISRPRPPPPRPPDVEPSLRKLKKTDPEMYLQRIEEKLAELQAENRSLRKQVVQIKGGVPPAGLEDELQRLRRRVKQLEADARQQAPAPVAVQAVPITRPPRGAPARSRSVTRPTPRGPPSPAPANRVPEPGMSPSPTYMVLPPHSDSLSSAGPGGPASVHSYARPWMPDPFAGQPFSAPPYGAPQPHPQFAHAAPPSVGPHVPSPRGPRRLSEDVPWAC